MSLSTNFTIENTSSTAVWFTTWQLVHVPIVHTAGCSVGTVSKLIYSCVIVYKLAYWEHKQYSCVVYDMTIGTCTYSPYCWVFTTEYYTYWIAHRNRASASPFSSKMPPWCSDVKCCKTPFLHRSGNGTNSDLWPSAWLSHLHYCCVLIVAEWIACSMTVVTVIGYSKWMTIYSCNNRVLTY